jgi:hypothetical protein
MVSQMNPKTKGNTEVKDYEAIVVLIGSQQRWEETAFIS